MKKQGLASLSMADDGPHLWIIQGSGHVQSCGAEILSHTIDAHVALQYCLHLLSEITACFLQH